MGNENSVMTPAMTQVLEVARRNGGLVVPGKHGNFYVRSSTVLVLVRRGELVQEISPDGGLMGRIPDWLERAGDPFKLLRPKVSKERQARVALWLCWMYMREDDDETYAYPRAEGWEERSEEWAQLADKAKKLADEILGRDADGEFWQKSVEEFSLPRRMWKS